MLVREFPDCFEFDEEAVDHNEIPINKHNPAPPLPRRNSAPESA